MPKKSFFIIEKIFKKPKVPSSAQYRCCTSNLKKLNPFQKANKYLRKQSVLDKASGYVEKLEKKLEDKLGIRDGYVKFVVKI